MYVVRTDFRDYIRFSGDRIGLMRFVPYLSLLLALVFYSGCTSTSSRFEAATKIDTISAYESFIETHPGPEWSSLAKRRIEKLVWRSLSKRNTSEAYTEYLSLYPEGVWNVEAQRCIQSIEWDRVKAERTVNACDLYLNKYPDCAASVDSLLDEILWGQVTIDTSLKSVTNYLQTFPSGLHLCEAQDLLDQYEEISEWSQLPSSKDFRDFDLFIRKYPSSEHADSAIKSIEDLYCPEYIEKSYRQVMLDKRKNDQRYGIKRYVVLAILESPDDTYYVYKGEDGALKKIVTDFDKSISRSDNAESGSRPVSYGRGAAELILNNMPVNCIVGYVCIEDLFRPRYRGIPIRRSLSERFNIEFGDIAVSSILPPGFEFNSKNKIGANVSEVLACAWIMRPRRIEELLERESPEVVRRIARTVKFGDNPADFIPAIDRLRCSDIVEDRKLAVELYQWCRGLDIVPSLEVLICDSNEDVSKAAERALVNIQNMGYGDLLIDFEKAIYYSDIKKLESARMGIIESGVPIEYLVKKHYNRQGWELYKDNVSEAEYESARRRRSSISYSKLLNRDKEYRRLISFFPRDRVLEVYYGYIRRHYWSHLKSSTADGFYDHCRYELEYRQWKPSNDVEKVFNPFDGFWRKPENHEVVLRVLTEELWEASDSYKAAAMIITLGDESSISSLMSAFYIYSNEKWAELFYNSGSRELVSCAKSWASRNGFVFRTHSTSDRIAKWGGG